MKNPSYLSGVVVAMASDAAGVVFGIKRQAESHGLKFSR